MDCNKAAEYIMRYMDSAINASEVAMLKKHFEKCQSCKEDFIVYDSIIEDFSHMPLVEVPEGFERNVMEKIEALGVVYDKGSLDNIWCAVWGAFSIVLGIGAILSINNEAILTYMSNNLPATEFIQIFRHISARFVLTTTQLANDFYNIAGRLGGYLETMRYFFIVILSILIGVQIYIYRKDKVETQ